MGASEAKAIEQENEDPGESTRPAHWTKPPTHDATLEWRFGLGEGKLYDSANMQGGGGGAFDPRAADNKMVGKLIRIEGAPPAPTKMVLHKGQLVREDDPDRHYKMVGKRLVDFGDSHVQRMRLVDSWLEQLDGDDRTVLYLAYGPPCVPAFAVALKRAETKHDVEEAGTERARARWVTKSLAGWLQVTILTEAAVKAWDAAGRPASLPQWLVEKPQRLKVPLAKAAELVDASWNRWADVRGRVRRHARHPDEASAMAALEAERA